MCQNIATAALLVVIALSTVAPAEAAADAARRAVAEAESQLEHARVEPDPAARRRLIYDAIRLYREAAAFQVPTREEWNEMASAVVDATALFARMFPKGSGYNTDALPFEDAMRVRRRAATRHDRLAAELIRLSGDARRAGSMFEELYGLPENPPQVACDLAIGAARCCLLEQDPTGADSWLERAATAADKDGAILPAGFDDLRLSAATLSGVGKRDLDAARELVRQALIDDDHNSVWRMQCAWAIYDEARSRDSRIPQLQCLMYLARHDRDRGLWLKQAFHLVAGFRRNLHRLTDSERDIVKPLVDEYLQAWKASSDADDRARQPDPRTDGWSLADLAAEGAEVYESALAADDVATRNDRINRALFLVWRVFHRYHQHVRGLESERVASLRARLEWLRLDPHARTSPEQLVVDLYNRERSQPPAVQRHVYDAPVDTWCTRQREGLLKLETMTGAVGDGSWTRQWIDFLAEPVRDRSSLAAFLTRVDLQLRAAYAFADQLARAGQTDRALAVLDRWAVPFGAVEPPPPGWDRCRRLQSLLASVRALKDDANAPAGDQLMARAEAAGAQGRELAAKGKSPADAMHEAAACYQLAKIQLDREATDAPESLQARGRCRMALAGLGYARAANIGEARPLLQRVLARD